MKLLLICVAMQSWLEYDLKTEINSNTRSIEFNRTKSLKEYEQTVIRLDGRGNVTDAYVYLMDSSSFDMANKKFAMSLDCKTKSK